MNSRPRSSKSRWSLNRRQFIRGAGVAAAAAAGTVFLGCGDDDAPSTSESTSRGESANDGDPKRGGNLRIGFPADLLGRDPHILAPSHRDTLWPILEGVTHYDHQFQPQPLLAASWEQSDGGATVVLKLRPGVTYHTGREFTSADVKWNLERVKDPNVPFAQFRLMANWFPGVETPDKETVVLKSERPRPATFDFFELFRMADSVTKSGPDAETSVIGTGPWKWVEWRQGEQLKVARYDAYWERGVPYLDELTWNLDLEGETLLSQFEAGALDVIDSPSIPGFIRLQSNRNFQTLLHPTPGAYYAMGFNVNNPPFNDKRVRQAFNWAIDRKRFAELTLEGLVEPFSLPWPKESLAYNEAQSNHYTFNLEEAATLLRAASATNLETTVTMRSGQPDVHSFVPIWQNDLKSIGVDLKISILDVAGFGQTINNRLHNSVWAGQASNAAMGAPVSLFTIAPNVWGGDGRNNTGFEHARYRELIEQAAVEMEPQRQRQIYSELNSIILDESHIPVTAPHPWRLAVGGNVRGITYDMQDSYEYAKAWLA